MSDNNIFRVMYYQNDDIYELYAQQVSQDYLYAFLEIEGIIFGERTELLVDPAEERLKTEFEGVVRTYVPLQNVIRIDEVEKAGTNKITHTEGNRGNVSAFPSPVPPKPRTE